MRQVTTRSGRSGRASMASSSECPEAPVGLCWRIAHSNRLFLSRRLTIEKTEACISEGSAARPGAGLLVAGLGRHAGVYTAGGSTAAGDQNRHAPRWPLLLDSFPKTLI